MVELIRKKSPRAPSMPLSEALDRVMRVYEKERLHETAVDIVASSMGYKSANNGAALAALASTRYYGLLERPKEGFLAVSKDVETYKFAPTEEQRAELLIKFLRTPPLYAELLDKYVSGLPSDASLKYELIQRGFIPAAAETALSSFKQSLAFSDYYNLISKTALPDELEQIGIEEKRSEEILDASPNIKALSSTEEIHEDSVDKIPVRLSGGRRAWLTIPTPFFEADKVRLKAQIDLLLSEDE